MPQSSTIFDGICKCIEFAEYREQFTSHTKKTAQIGPGKICLATFSGKRLFFRFSTVCRRAIYNVPVERFLLVSFAVDICRCCRTVLGPLGCGIEAFTFFRSLKTFRLTFQRMRNKCKIINVQRNNKAFSA